MSIKVTVSSGTSKTESQGKTNSTGKKTLDEKLRDRILAGLMGYMSDEEMETYAQNLLRPVLQAEKEAAQQKYETIRLSREQEIKSLSAALARDIAAQESVYRRSMADIQTAALARGMGRSSYTLETLAGRGDALSQAVMQLTRESGEKQADVQDQLTLAAQQNAATQARLDGSYARQLAAKVQELRDAQRQQYNQQYLAATSASMGQTTTQESYTTSGTATDSLSAEESAKNSVVTEETVERLKKVK